MRHKKKITAGIAAILLCAGANSIQAQPPRKLLDPANMDLKTKPSENFYRYANGAWLDNNPIPPSETRWGSFSELLEFNYAALLSILNEAAYGTNKKGPNESKVGLLYRQGMDSSIIEKQGLDPVKVHFKRIDAIANTTDLMNEIAYEHTIGLSPVFGFYISPDDKQVTNQIAQFYQGGLGMPDRDYYFKDDARTKKIRNAYQGFIGKMLQLGKISAGAPHLSADAIFKIEMQLAKASMTRVEMRDPYNLYNKFNLAGINAQTPGLDWGILLKGLKVMGQDSLIVGQPKFFATLGNLIQTQPLADWKIYLKYHLLSAAAPYLNHEIDDLNFRFYGTEIRGQQEQKPRWKRVLTVVDNNIGELLGQIYVEKNFKPAAKERMLNLVNSLQLTYGGRIERLDWMTNATKKKALAKLNTFVKKIGYPDKWKDYNKLALNGRSYFDNILQASAFEYDFNINKLGRPVDKGEWGMTPPTVNAYYNPAFNEIVFPAGILQYPFFDFEADDAVNYGGIGAVIGHEMTHGFDDQGRQYDAAGNLNDWWQPEDAKKFDAKAKVVIEQFNTYTVLDTVHVNGELTLGENLADLGGLAIAYEAFMNTTQAKEGKKIDGFTPEQRFFLSWAQVWRANTRPEEMASRIVTDPHSPNELRGNGPLSNMPEFYKAFDVKPGDKMYREPAMRAKIW